MRSYLLIFASFAYAHAMHFGYLNLQTTRCFADCVASTTTKFYRGWPVKITILMPTLVIFLSYDVFNITPLHIHVYDLQFLYARLHTGRIMVWWCLSVRPSGSPSVSHSFPNFSPTCFDVFSWNFACDFLLMNIWSSSSVVNFRQDL